MVKQQICLISLATKPNHNSGYVADSDYGKTADLCLISLATKPNHNNSYVADSDYGKTGDLFNYFSQGLKSKPNYHAHWISRTEKSRNPENINEGDYEREYLPPPPPPTTTTTNTWKNKQNKQKTTTTQNKIKTEQKHNSEGLFLFVLPSMVDISTLLVPV